MAAFKFRLQSVLRLRDHARDHKRWQLRAMYESKRQMIEELDALERELRHAGAHVDGGEIVIAIDLKMRAAHEQSLVRRIKGKRAEIAQFDEVLAQKRGELVEAMRAVKSLEQLRERQRERFVREQNAAEQKFGDEVGQQKFAGSQVRKKNPS